MSWLQAIMPKVERFLDLFRRHAGREKTESATTAEGAQQLQYGALPYRKSTGVEVLLVTSRETRRWVIPKGWPMKDLSADQAAAREAFEEAGVTCMPADAPLGAFRYQKRLKTGDAVECEVLVFPMRVGKVHKDWPEKRERKRRWFAAAEAAAAVDEEGLKAIILQFAQTEQR
ncbi:MAG: NUDIX hydrolase [Alphaproteobacteria bacterium]